MQLNEPLRGAYVDVKQLLALRFASSAAQEVRRHDRVVGNRAGAKLSKIKGRGVDLAEVRAYQPGDDIRSIDWRVTARTNKPHTKVFREERERPTMIVVDQTQNMFFGSRERLKSVAAAELAARTAWQTLAAGDRVGGVVVNNTGSLAHRPYRTSKAVARFLNDIAQSNQALNRGAQGDNLLPAMRHVRRLARSNHQVIIISDFGGPLDQWQEHLHNLARSNRVHAWHVFDPLESVLPPANHYLITNGRERMAFYSGDQGTRERFRQQFLERAEQLAAICQHESMTYQQQPTFIESDHAK